MVPIAREIDCRISMTCTVLCCAILTTHVIFTSIVGVIAANYPFTYKKQLKSSLIESTAFQSTDSTLLQGILSRTALTQRYYVKNTQIVCHFVVFHIFVAIQVIGWHRACVLL